MKALVRELSPEVGGGELTHFAREAIDVELAMSQHAAYVDLLRSLGCELEWLACTPELPDSVFVEDAAVVVDELAVLTRPGAVSRRRELASVADALRPHRELHAIVAPGTLDGGDVLRIDERVYVGQGSRTNAAGARQLRDLLRPLGYRVITVPVDACLHLKSAITRVSPDTVLVNPAWVATEAFSDYRRIEVDPSEPGAANALMIGERVIHPQAHARTRGRLTAAGLEILPVPQTELAKAEGGVTCCSILLGPQA